MIEAVIFDLGNVLVRFCHDRMCRQMAALCGRSGEDIRRGLVESGLMWEFERGEVDVAEFHERFTNTIGVDTELADLLRAGSDIFEDNPGVLDIVAELKSLGLRLVLMSNTSSAHFEFVRDNFDVLRPFDEYVLSYKVGAAKPDDAIYNAAIQAAGTDPKQIFYTDDIADYVAAGRRLGLQAEVFTTAEELRRQLSARNVLR